MSPGWPDLSSGDSEALLAPFLTCASPGEFVALQQRVDMPRLMEALDDWSAVRLGALGPVREDAAAILHRKRVSFLLAVTERYGLFYAEVFALFVLHSAHDDDVAEVLRLLARDKQLGQTLALMPAVREELEARGLSLSAYPDRGERASDVLRGLGRAARDALSSSQASDVARYTGLCARREQLPAPYRDALHEARGDVARAQALMSKAVPGATGSSAVGRGAARAGGPASLVDEQVGLTREVVEAKLARVEWEATGPRLSREVTVLERQRPSLDVPPPEAQGNPRWREYVDYYERRLGELKEGKATKGPLRWENYERMWGWFARGLTFERLMVKVLREDALLPRAQRRFLGDFNKPRVEANVGCGSRAWLALCGCARH
ncbi:hypothetical protein ACN28S_49535 [Cystobacter fuscus]